MEQHNKFNVLPNEILFHIFSFFNKRDQGCALRVSKRFYEASKQLKDLPPYPNLDYSKVLPEKSKSLTVTSSGVDVKDMQGVHCIAVLSEQHFVTGTKNGILIVWDANKAEPIRLFNKHAQHEFKMIYKIIPVSATAFISCGQQGTVYLWDIHQDKNKAWDEPLITFKGHATTKGAVQEALFIKEKNLLVTGCSDKTLRIWDVETGKCLHAVVAYTHDVGFIATFAHNLIVSTSNNSDVPENDNDYNIKLWRLEPDAKLTLLTTLKGHTETITAFCKLSDKLLATGSADGTLRIWNIEESLCIKTIKLPRSYQPTCLKRITPSYLACGIVSQDIEDCIYLYNIKDIDFPFVKSLAGHEYGLLGPNSLLDLENGYFASVDCVDSDIRVWHVDESECLLTFESPENIKELTKLPNGNVISSHFDKNSLNIWAFPERDFKPITNLTP